MSEPTIDPPLSPNDLLTSLRASREDESLRSTIEIKRWLSVLSVLLPAALRAAAEGNPEMIQAVQTIWPLLPKSKNPGS